MIKIYGSPRSSAGRCYWLLEELGLPYQRQPLDMRAKEHKREPYSKLNPNGKVPCVIDGDFVIWESMAINGYLVDKYESPLRGATAEARGLISQWSFWALLELQRPLIEIFIQLVFVPEAKRDHGVIEKARVALPPMLTILDCHLVGKEWMVGDAFTLADLHVASVANLTAAIHYDMTPYALIQPWLERCKARPAFQRSAALEP